MDAVSAPWAPASVAGIASIALGLPIIGLYRLFGGRGTDSADASGVAPVLLEGPASRVVGIPARANTPLLFRLDLPGTHADDSWIARYMRVQRLVLPGLPLAEARVHSVHALQDIARASVVLAPDSKLSCPTQRVSPCDKVFIWPSDLHCTQTTLSSLVFGKSVNTALVDSVYMAVTFEPRRSNSRLFSVALCFDWLILGVLPYSLLPQILAIIVLVGACLALYPRVLRRLSSL